jgi:protein-L-isoaspartate O-methyltransferase
VQRICEGKAHSCNGLIFRQLDENGNLIIPVAQTRKRRTAIYGVKKDNPNDIVYYESISEAARQEHIDRSSISKCLAG